MSAHPPASAGGEQAHLLAASLRRRVAVMVLALLAILVVVLGVFVDLTLSQRLRSDLQTRLVDRAQQGQNLAGQLAPQELVDRISGNGIAASLTTGAGVVYGRVPAAAPGAPGPPVPPGAEDRARPTRPSPPAPPGRVVTSGDLAATARVLPDGSTLRVVADGASITTTLITLRAITIVGGLVVLALAALLIGRVVGAALRPLGTMTALARSITAGDRGARLRPDRDDTEIGAAAAAFDEALDALEGAEARALAAEGRMRDFLADASHELRTPVAGIQAAAETLLRTNPPRAAREDLAVTMVRETRRAARLIADLSQSASQGSDLGLTTTALDLGALVADQVVRARTLHPDLTITFRRQDGAGPQVVGDPGRIGQVLANVVANAAHATAGRGRVDLSVALHPGDGSPMAVVDIDDDGLGVPPDQRERIFQRLVRLDPSRQRATGGAGLGLAISRAIARAHGGDLTCLPPPGQRGARFRLTLPAPPPQRGGDPCARS